MGRCVALADQDEGRTLSGRDVDDPCGQRGVHEQAGVDIHADGEAGAAQEREAGLPGRRLLRRAAEQSPYDAAVGPGDARADGESDLRLGGVLQSHEDALAQRLAVHVGHRHHALGAFDDQRRRDDRHQDQHEHGVDHRLVEEADVEADHGRRQGRGRWRMKRMVNPPSAPIPNRIRHPEAKFGTSPRAMTGTTANPA
jgi:hypothetical protein